MSNVKILSFEEFFENTLGGRPNQAQMHIYNGKEYECGCGDRNLFYETDINVIRQLPGGLKFVFLNEKCGFVTCVKIKGLFSYKIESLFSAKEN